MTKVLIIAFVVFDILLSGTFLYFQINEPMQSREWAIGQLLINAVAIIAAGVALWRYIASARVTLKKIESALPTLFEIAEQFNPNARGGESLRTAIDEIRHNQLSIQAQCELLLETSSTAIFVTDKAGSCTFVNASWVAMTGLAFEDALEHGWSTAVHDEDRRSVFDDWIDAVKNKRPFYREFRFVNEISRKIQFVRVRATAISDRKGSKEPIAFLGQVKLLKCEDY